MASGDNGSLLIKHSEDREKAQLFVGENGCSKGEVNNRRGEIGREQDFPSKKAKHLRDGQASDVFPVEEHPSNCDLFSKSGDGNMSGNDVASSREVPDVADTIEDLLVQTSKVSAIYFFLQLFNPKHIFSGFTSGLLFRFKIRTLLGGFQINLYPYSFCAHSIFFFT